MITTARHALQSALDSGPVFEDFAQLMQIKHIIARLETTMAKGQDKSDLRAAGATAEQARIIERRASYRWHEKVPVEHQDIILGALDRLSPASTRRDEIYDLAADVAQRSTPRQTSTFVNRLVREENDRLAGDPHEAYRQRSFTMRPQDVHGGCRFSGYMPAATAALFKSLLDQAFRAQEYPEGQTASNVTVAQRTADAFDQVVRWASSDRRTVTGHCSLVVSVTEDDGFDWRSKFATNVGIDLNLFDIDVLSGDNITDYVVVHNHKGAVKSLVTAQRCANFYQRIMLTARDLVCQHPDCDVPASRCDAHHVVPWAQGGITSIGNLTLMCGAHHRENDDNWIEDHMEMRLGRAVHVTSQGDTLLNASPAALSAAAWRLPGLGEWYLT